MASVRTGGLVREPELEQAFSHPALVARLAEQIAADRKYPVGGVMVRPLWTRDGTARYRVNFWEDKIDGVVRVHKIVDSAFLLVPDSTNGRGLPPDQLAKAVAAAPVTYREQGEKVKPAARTVSV